jgi:hypothetical protein
MYAHFSIRLGKSNVRFEFLLFILSMRTQKWAIKNRVRICGFVVNVSNVTTFYHQCTVVKIKNYL